MSTPTSTRQWILARQPTGAPILTGPSATFSLVTAELPPLEDGQVLCRVKYISNDPGQRGFIGIGVADDRMYVPPVHVGTPMRAGIIAEVVESRAAPSTNITVGSTVMTLHLGRWAEHVVLDAADCQLLDPPPGLAATHFLGALGAPGLTAYYGVFEVLKARPEHTLVVSGAAGATGAAVVQIAKRLVGCKRVVGIAGGADKCAWVRESLGADACVDYKSASFTTDLARATSDGYVDLYFDNVGGDVLDAMLPRMARGATVAVCGAISTYNDAGPMRLRNWMEVVSMRLQLKGFILLDYAEQIPRAIAALVEAVKEGKVVLGAEHETLVETGIEGVPEVWMKLFEGANRGKLVTKLVV